MAKDYSESVIESVEEFIKDQSTNREDKKEEQFYSLHEGDKKWAMEMIARYGVKL